MTGGINRVASEKVTVWSKIVMWIYGVVHGDPYKLKKKQSSEEMIRSANAFEDVQEIFSEEDSNSMNNEELLDHTTKNFRRRK